MNIAKAQEHSALARRREASREELKKGHLFVFQSGGQSEYLPEGEKLGKYPQTPVRLDTDSDPQIAEETIAPLPLEVEKQLRQEEELRQKQRADTLTIEEEESEEMEARLTQLVSQNSLQTAQEMADLKNQLVNLQLQQAQQISTIANQTLQNANRLDGGGAAISIFGSGKSIPRFNMESDPNMSISDWIQLFNDVQDIRGVSVPVKVKDLKALLSGSVRSWLDDYLKQEGYNDAFVNAN